MRYFEIAPITPEKTLEQFYLENNIDEQNIYYLGKGDFGTAYSIGNGRVLKYTSSPSEFKIAQELENTSSNLFRSAFALIFKTEIIQNQYLIILEQLDADNSDIENLWYQLSELLEISELPVQYIDNIDLDELEDMGYTISEKLIRFINDIEEISRAYKHLGIEASDIRPENLGFDKSGVIKAFDIDNKNR